MTKLIELLSFDTYLKSKGSRPSGFCFVDSKGDVVKMLKNNTSPKRNSLFCKVQTNKDWSTFIQVYSVRMYPTLNSLYGI